VGRLLSWTTDYLQKHGSASPRLDAEVLLAHVLECKRIELYTSYDAAAAEDVRARYRELIKRRAAGTPVAYLVGHREFYSLDFEVTPDVLIPRPETEHLVVEALDCAKQLAAHRDGHPLRIVDVGTGSGCVAVALARHFPAASIVAVDISSAALDVARRNVQRHGLADRIELVEGDLLDQIAPPVDMILSNPPYVTESEYAALDPTVREHEPRLALVADQQGWGVIDRLLDQARTRLADQGYLLLEVSPMLAEQAADRIGNAWEIRKITKDLAGLPRVLTLQRTGV